MVTVRTPQASAELRRAYDNISKDFLQSALKVIEEITRIADQLPAQPEMFPPDKLRSMQMLQAGFEEIRFASYNLV